MKQKLSNMLNSETQAKIKHASVQQTIIDKRLLALCTAGYVEGFRSLSSRVEARFGGHASN